MNQEITLLNEAEIKAKANGYLAMARTIEVVSEETSLAAQTLIVGIKEVVKRWKNEWAPLKASAKAHHQLICDREGVLLKEAEPIIARLSGKIAEWVVAEREKAARAEEDRREAEWRANRAQAEAESKIANAVSFEEAAAVVVPEPAILPAVEKPVLAGVQVRDKWEWEVEDFDRIERRWLKADEEMIGREVTRLKDKCVIPGIRVFNKPYTASAPNQFKRRIE